MQNIIFALIVTSALTVWLFGWHGVCIVLLFLFGAWGYSKSGAVPGRVQKFIEKLGVDDDEK